MGEPITDHHMHGIPVDIENMEPVPVHIVGTSVEDLDAAPYGAWQSLALLGTEPAQQLLAQDFKRKRAQISIGPGFSNQNVAGYVLVGTRAQVQNGQGGILFNGSKFDINNTRELWIVGDNVHSLTVTVLDERYK